MAYRIKLHHAGIAEVLKSDEVAVALGNVADAIAATAEAHDEVQRHGVDVEVEEYETDRVAFSVTLAHPAGRAIEAKYGTLTQAAGDAGLEVRSYE